MRRAIPTFLTLFALAVTATACARWPLREVPWLVVGGGSAALLLLGAMAITLWVVVHNVRCTQRDLALKAAQLSAGLSVGADEVLGLLMQYAYDATGQRLPLMSASAVSAPVPHIRAVTVGSGREVLFTPEGASLARHLRGSLSSRPVGRYPLTARKAGLLAPAVMRQVWRCLAEEDHLSPVERVLPHAAVWAVFLVGRRPLPRGRRLALQRLRAWWRRCWRYPR